MISLPLVAALAVAPAHAVQFGLGAPTAPAVSTLSGIRALAIPTLPASLVTPSSLLLQPQAAAATSLQAASKAVTRVQATSAGERAAGRAASRSDAVAKGTIFLVEDFRSNLLGNSRTVAVYLPPGYETSRARYPVLYMQDGQNIFDPATSYVGVDWGLRETCDRLIAAGKMAPIIIVAPYNTPERESEYTPVRDESQGGGGSGDLYGRFLVEELKPVVDARWRTRPGPGDTAIMGSSLGGLISLHLALTRPDAFSLAGAVSPSLWWASEEILKRAAFAPPPDPLPKIWADMGTREGLEEDEQKQGVERLKKLAAILETRGWAPGVNFGAKIYEGAEHNEVAWRERAGFILTFLFPPRP